MNVTLTLTIPAKIDAGETSPKYRGVKFISPAVQGLEAAERCTGGAAPNCAGSAVGNAQTRVPGAGAGENQQILYYVASSVCNNASPRVCTITFPSYAPAAGQTAQFEIDLLDTAPPSNASAGGPASANLLGAGLTLPGQTPSGNTSLTITTFEGIVGSVIFPATSSTGTVHDGAGSNFGNIGNAKLQINFGAGSIFIASYVGAGNGNGIAISGFGFNVAQDVRANLIGTASSGCAVSGPDEYGNSLTPSGSNDTNDLQNNSTRSGVYAQLTPTSGQSAQHYAGEVLTGERPTPGPRTPFWRLRSDRAGKAWRPLSVRAAPATRRLGSPARISPATSSAGNITRPTRRRPYPIRSAATAARPVRRLTFSATARRRRISRYLPPQRKPTTTRA